MSGSTVSGVREALQAVVRRLDVDVLDGAEAERLLVEFTRIEHAAAAAKALVARRVAVSGRWKASGERSAADRVAKRTGETVGAARTALDTAERLQSCPATEAAFRAGELSVPQAAAVASAAAVAPDTEPLLLGMAGHTGVKKLRDACGRIRAAALPDPEARYAELHRTRSFVTWTDPDGARCGRYRLPPDLAAKIEAAIKPYADAAFRQARAEGRHEASDAYAADGLVALAESGGGTTKTDGVLLVNAESLRRGNVEPGELCEIAGIGPVPVSVARDLLGDTLLKIVIRDGIDIRTVIHTGRKPTPEMRTALLVRQLGRCARPTCDRPVQEIDHTHDWHDTHQTRLDSLAGLCRPDHLLKTHHHHTYTHGDHGWEWHHPDGQIEHERPPPGS